MKTLARLQRQKHSAVDSMEQLNNRAYAQSRNLTEIEALKYRLKKAWAEDLNAVIYLAQKEFGYIN
jgi:hypothetical protein